MQSDHFSIVVPLAAICLDLLLGDPRWFPHPVRLIGFFALRFEIFFRSFTSNKQLAGILTIIFLLLLTYLFFSAIIHFATAVHPLAGQLAAVFIFYTTLATRDLIRHSRKVYGSLQENDIVGARKNVAMIVGRDTGDLSEAGVSKAAIESVAENMVDGITAPLFWGILAGPVGAMLYKVVNTCDSMFGYKNEKYLEFGWAPARLDDLVNFVPARLSALLIPLAAYFLNLNWKKSFLILKRDRKQHASPNSGHAEAAVAGALDIELGGSSSYFGKKTKKPTLGDSSAQVTADHIIITNHLVLLSSAIFAALLLIIRFLV